MLLTWTIRAAPASTAPVSTASAAAAFVRSISSALRGSHEYTAAAWTTASHPLAADAMAARSVIGSVRTSTTDGSHADEAE